MKKFLLSILASAFVGLFTASAQGEETIIYLDFQDWEASPGVKYEPPDSCERSGGLIVTGPDTKLINYETGGSGEVTLWKYWVAPECNCKVENRDGGGCQIDITTGWVALGKQPTEEDTIGQFILPKLSNVTWIEVGFSCTGADRGVRIYASTDDGANWGEPIGGEHLASGAQFGDFATEDINMDNVIIKITSGVDDENNTQYVRLHNIEVKGVPGGPETGTIDLKAGEATVYYRAKEGLVIEGDLSDIQIFDITGRMMKRSLRNGSQTIDVSEFSKGVYILRANDRENRVFTQKFAIR